MLTFLCNDYAKFDKAVSNCVKKPIPIHVTCRLRIRHSKVSPVVTEILFVIKRPTDDRQQTDREATSTCKRKQDLLFHILGVK